MPDLGFKVVALSVVLTGLAAVVVLLDPDLPARTANFFTEKYHIPYRDAAVRVETALYYYSLLQR